MSRLFELYGVNFKKGEYIFKEGDGADILYMIHKGEVEINKKSGKVYKTLQILGEGEFVGEMAIIDSLPRSANAVAHEDCQLIKMDKLSFDNSIKDNHEFSISVIQFLTKRLRDTNDEVVTMSGVKRRHGYLIEVLKEFISNGKNDQSGNWRLLELDPLIENFKSKFDIDSEKLLSLFNDLVEEGKIKFKKDKNKSTWVAYKLIND